MTKPEKRVHRHAPLHSSASVEWATPPELFAALDRELGPFDLDPAAAAWNHKTARYFDALADGLAQRWTGRVWLNPPYGATIGAWMDKAAAEVAAGRAELVVCLVPARTDTAWWHRAVAAGAEVRFLAGRLRFVGVDGVRSSAPFPSAVLVFRRAGSATPPPGDHHCRHVARRSTRTPRCSGNASSVTSCGSARPW